MNDNDYKGPTDLPPPPPPTTYRRGLPHGGPISYGFSGWTSVVDALPPKEPLRNYLVCNIDGEVNVQSAHLAGRNWTDNENAKPIIAWARIPMIDEVGFREHYEDHLSQERKRMSNKQPPFIFTDPRTQQILVMKREPESILTFEQLDEQSERINTELSDYCEGAFKAIQARQKELERTEDNLKSIHATLIVNFGPDGRAGKDCGVTIPDAHDKDKKTINLLIEVLELFIKKCKDQNHATNQPG